MASAPFPKFVLFHDKLDAPILRPSFGSLIAGDRLGLAIAGGCEARGIDAGIADVAGDRLRPPLRQVEIGLRRALRIRVPRDLDAGSAAALPHFDQLVQQRQRLLAELRASGLEQNPALTQETSEFRLAFVDRQRGRWWSHADIDGAQLEAARKRADELGLDLIRSLIVDREPFDIEDRILRRK